MPISIRQNPERCSAGNGLTGRPRPGCFGMCKTRLWDQFSQDKLEQEGHAILRYEHELVGKLAAQAVMVEFQGEMVPSVQSAILTSQIGERLSPHYPFCVIWHDRDGRRYFSMRSRQDGTDVGAIAASFGGGGHTHAAGFSVHLESDGALPAIPSLPRAVTDRLRVP